jgi:F-type H+-transporting ATPase subunit b
LHSLVLFGDSTSGIGALGVDGKAFVIQLITFGLAYLVLRRYAFGPIMRVMNDRRDTIEKGVKLGEQMQKDKAKLEAEVEKTLHDTRAKADAILSDAQDAGRQAVREAEEKAKQKAAGILASAEDRIVQDTKRARKALEKEIVGLVSEVTEAVIEEKVDGPKDVQLIERALKGRTSA